MHSALIIARREYLATIRTKAFLIGLIIAPLFMGGSIIGMALLNDKVDTNDRRIVILDDTGTIGDALIAAANLRNEHELFDRNGKRVRPAYLIELHHSDPDIPRHVTLLNLSNQVRSGALFGFLEIGPDLLTPATPTPSASPARQRVAFFSKNPALDDMRAWLRDRINEHVREIHVKNFGLDPTTVATLFQRHPVDGMQLLRADDPGEIREPERANEIASIATPALLMFFLFMLVMMGAMPLFNSVMEEKNQHIAETLLSSITPFQFMFGKVLGGVAISLTASAFYIVATLFTLGNMGLMGFVPMELIPWFLLYLVLSILMMGSIMAGIGATCSDLKEGQNLTLPAMIPILIPMFVMMPVIKEPLSSFATILSLIPPFTPMLMMLRQAVPGGVPMWQPAVGLVGLLLFTLFCIWMGSRIFRAGILFKGKTPGFATLLHWIIRG
jgi:ABC-2 type transport system permease protein